jgi:general secretion pathway protein G
MSTTELRRRVRRDVVRAAARDARGFTLLEVMVVIIIIGTIAGLVGVNVLNRLEESKMRAAKIQLSTLRDALDMFKMDNGFYPDSGQGLNALVAPPDVGRGVTNFRRGGYLRDNRVPFDPWGLPYNYLCDDGYIFQVWSNGPDGRPGTEDDIFP